MKKGSFLSALLKGLGYIVLGNILCLIMTMAIYMFGRNIFVKVLSITFAALILISMMFTVSWLDGSAMRKTAKLDGSFGKTPPRWIFIGLILYAVAAAPTFFLLINKLAFPEQDNLIVYQFISGTSYPFVLAFTPRPDSVVSNVSRVEQMSVLLPALLPVYYLVVPVSCQAGFWCGYNDKPNINKMVYK